jgi:hypothetical protein
VKVAELEREMKTLENSLTNPPADPARVQQIGSNYTSLQQKIELLMQTWTEEHIRLENNSN